MSIQGSINSMISSASHAVGMVKGYQALKQKEAEKAAKAKQQAAQQITRQQANAMMAQKGQDMIDQKQEFTDSIRNLETSFGGKVKDLPEALQAKILEQYGKEDK